MIEPNKPEASIVELSMIEIIEKNNKTHNVLGSELQPLLKQAKQVYQSNFDNSVWFERSIFTNWTCAIADCKYCYLSTKPKFDFSKETKSLRSVESLLSEVIICNAMGWRVGYITGGLRVEKTDYLIELLDQITKVNGKKIMMNFGPYSHNVIQKLKPHLTGMGSAIE